MLFEQKAFLSHNCLKDLNDDQRPLEEWMGFGVSGARISPVDLEKNIDQAMKDLARLEEFLDNPPPKANLYQYIPRGIPSVDFYPFR